MRTTLVCCCALGVMAITAGSALAGTIYVAQSCSGEPAPCTTDLQSALDNTRYSNVEIVAGAKLEGDFIIERSLTLQGGTGSEVDTGAGDTYCLRVESTSSVNVRNLALVGRVAIYDASSVTFDGLDIAGTDVGVQVVDSADVRLEDLSIDATDRALDAWDSLRIDVVGGTWDAGDYAAVASSSTVTVDDADLHGDHHTFVLQDGDAATTSTLTAVDSTLTAGSGQETTWRWTSTTTTYRGCSPTPTESTSQSGELVDPLSYYPYGGT